MAKKATTKKTVSKKTPAKKTAAKKTATKKTAARKTTARKTPAKKTVTRKKAAPKPTETTITARADVGFGNTLYLRGEGGGLSWDTGLPMVNTASDTWVWSTATGEALTFKFLINDTYWSAGEDFTVPAGASTTEVPSWD